MPNKVECFQVQVERGSSVLNPGAEPSHEQFRLVPPLGTTVGFSFSRLRCLVKSRWSVLPCRQAMIHS
jgi:hypothetical protein